MSSVADLARRIHANVATVIKGKPEAIDQALVCLLAEGHLLVEDKPGLGKTSLARALAASVRLSCQRIQFTPDLLPSDVLGATVYRQGSETFEFRPGPIFAQVVLADEINRAAPKTQSALLEVMEERRVTVDRHTHPVPLPFFVVATQNPVEMGGTYRLPEAQLDRFLMRIVMGYPDAAAEAEILAGRAHTAGIDVLRPVADAAELAQAITGAAAVSATPELRDYIVAIAAATRNRPEVLLGVSPRGSMALLRAARARAAIEGRQYATAADVKALTPAVCGHRMILTPQAELDEVSAESVLRTILEDTPVPSSRVAW